MRLGGSFEEGGLAILSSPIPTLCKGGAQSRWIRMTLLNRCSARASSAALVPLPSASQIPLSHA